MKLAKIWIAAALLPLGMGVAQAQTDEEMARVREALRTTTVQLRTAQSDLAVAQADKAQLTEDNAALQRRLDNLARQSAEDHAAMQANIADLRARLADKEAEARRLAEQLLEWQRSHDQLRDQLAEKTDAHADASETVRIMRRNLSELRSMNRELHRIGVEVLERYENFSFGRSVATREPFTRITRARLQTILQDYADALDDNRIRIDDDLQ